MKYDPENMWYCRICPHVLASVRTFPDLVVLVRQWTSYLWTPMMNDEIEATAREIWEQMQ